MTNLKKFGVPVAKTSPQGRGIPTMILVYKTNTWHSHDSKELIGVCTNIDSAIKITDQRAKKEGFSISSEQRNLLLTIFQTQSYYGPGEFYMEEVPVNILF